MKSFIWKRTGWVAIMAASLFALSLSSCEKEKEKEQEEENPPVVVTDHSILASVRELDFAGDGGELEFKIEATEAWKVTSRPTWLTVEPLQGDGNKAVKASAAANPDDKQRSGTLTISLANVDGKVASILVKQAEKGGEAPPPDDPPVDPPGPEDPPIDDGPDESSLFIPKADFVTESVWGVTGGIMDLGWNKDLPMYEEASHGWTACFGVTITAEEAAAGKDGIGEFKFRKDGDWAVNLGAGKGQPELDKRYKLADDGGNLKLPAGTYDVYIQPTFMLLYVLPAGADFRHGDAVAEAEVGENVRIYVLNNSTWTKPYLYVYGAGGALQPNGSWPGTYAAGTKQYGDYTWTYWEASGFSGVGGMNLILNNSGTEQYPAPDTTDPLLSDLTILNTLYFVWDGSKVTQVEDPNNPGVSGKGIEPDKMEFGSSSWTIIGTLGGTNWDYDFPMDTEGYWEVAREVSIAAGEQFKFRQNRKWDVNLGSGEWSESGATTVTLDSKITLADGAGNMSVAASGTYDIYLCVENRIAYVLNHGASWTHEADGKPDYGTGGQYDPNLDPSRKASGLTYQVNVFSFKDSDGDGYGDFRGLISELDYFDKLGVTALWLSPIQPAQSYHGYDVTDYEAVNKRYGTMEDFQELVDKAHQHNIRIYLDYVMNHAGDQNKWFLDVKDNGTKSPYWNYFSLSKNPEADIKAGKIAQVPPEYGYNKYKWFPVLIGGKGTHRYKIDLDWTNASAPKMTVTETSEAVTTTGTYNNPERYLYWGDGTYSQFVDNGSNKYTLVLDYESAWGCLVRTVKSDVWTGKTKWGFNKTGDQMQLGVAHTLYSDDNPDNVQSIVMPGGELYYYYTEFGTGMFVDFNYGKASECKSSAAFKAIMHGVDMWLSMGVDGFRLDAVKHIYANETGPENKQFWNAFYEESNKLYKQNKNKRSGLKGIVDDNIFMVGEVLSGDGDCTPFYSGLPALFEFQFWWDLRECLNGESIWNAGYGQNFPGSLRYRWENHRGVRSDAISTPKLANHDEDRTASTLGNYKPKIRLAAAVLLTAAGRPYIYQGEELGYWGTKSGGDEYVRTPILWTTSQSSAASKGVSNKVDWNMLQPGISVERQSADESSLLMLYRHFGYARSVNPALANGWPEPDERTMNSYDGHVAGWYLHEVDGDKVVLVLHNFSSYTIDVSRWPGENATAESILVANGKVSVSGNVSSGTTVSLPGYSSVVFALN